MLRHFPVDKINSVILLNEETCLKTKQREKCRETFKDTLKRHSKICTGAKSENQFKVFHKIFLQESHLKIQLPTHNRNTAVHIVADFPLDEIILMNAKINVKTKIGSLKINGIQY